MATGSTPRQHHTVPEFYLRRFADKSARRPRLNVLDLEQRRWRTGQNPKEVATARDFYAVDLPPLSRNVVETEVLGQFESEIAPLLDELERRAVGEATDEPKPFEPSPEDHRMLAFFAAMMHSRRPGGREVQRRMAREMGRSLLDSLAQTEGEFAKNRAQALAGGADVAGLTYEAVRQMVDGAEIDFDVDQTTHVSAMLGGWRTLGAALLAKDCSLLAAGGRAGLLVASDSPSVCYRHGTNSGFDLARVDPRDSACGVLIPIGPKAALVFDSSLPSILRRMTQEEVAQANAFITLAGARLVFSLTKSFRWLHPEKGIRTSVEELFEAADELRPEMDQLESEEAARLRRAIVE